MFSGNDRISARQIKYLLILEWTAKLGILLPIILSGRSVGSMIFCVILGAAAWSAVILPVIKWFDPGKGFFEQLCTAMGKPAALLGCAAGFVYFIVQASVFTNLCAEITALYLLPELTVPLLCVLPVLAGVYLAYGSVEIRGRFCEVVGPAVLCLMALLIFAAVSGVEGSGGESTQVSLDDHLIFGTFEVFACMGGMFVPMLLGHCREEKEGGYGRTIRKAGLISIVLAGSLCAAAALAYGRNGMQAIDFPTVRVMSNMKVPDTFWQRWDIPFLALLIVSLTVNIAGALWGIREILQVLWREGLEFVQKRGQMMECGQTAESGQMMECGQMAEYRQTKYVYISWLATAVLIYLAAAGFLNAFTAVCYYRAMNMQILIPFMFFFYIIMGVRRRKRTAQNTKKISCLHRMPGQKEKRKWRVGNLSGMIVLVLVLLAAIFFVSGCSARDPEERLYPMALEIGMQDGKLAVTYAWSEGLGPAMAEEGDTKNEESSGANTEQEDGVNSGSGTQEHSAEDGINLQSETQENDMGIESEMESESKTQANKSRNMHTDQISSSKNLTTLKGSSLAEIQKLEDIFSERQLDYSHVKALILRDSLQEYPETEREVIKWLAEEPALASGMLVYRSGEDAPGLKEAEEHSSGQVGEYLENLYKNSETYRAMATTLGAVIREYYAEKSLSDENYFD